MALTYPKFLAEGHNRYELWPPGSVHTIPETVTGTSHRIYLVGYANGEVWETDVHGKHIRLVREAGPA